jgi:Protein of unknown function (DUF4239)
VTGLILTGSPTMPIWLYQIRPIYTALLLVVFIETVSLIGLVLSRRLLLPRLRYDDGANDAVSGTVQAIGVFYGITVGLIAVGVWTTYSNASELVSREAMAVGALYRDVSGFPQPVRGELQAEVRDYTVYVIEKAWPAQKIGQSKLLSEGTKIMDNLQAKLYTFEPATPGQTALHNETIKAFNNLIEARNLRIDAVSAGLSTEMWAVIWIGAIISISVAYFFRIPDLKLHAILVGLIAGFLAMVLFLIVVNDKPFYGYVSVSPEPYQLILNRVIDGAR